METIENLALSVAYKMYTIENGEEEFMEEATRQQPFQFISGLGMTLDAFENQLTELKTGDTFDFIIPMAEAYGEYDDEHIYDLPKEVFFIDGKFDNTRVVKGAILPMRTSDGHVLNGSVAEVFDDKVVMDMNHPLAGCDLHFKGQVLESRPATNEELTQMANILAGHHCGGGCGGCGGGNCGSGCDDGCEGGCCGGC